MLATDALIKKSYGGTTTTTLASLIPQLWAAQLERNLRIRACLQQSIVENTDLMVPNSGNEIFIPILPDFTYGQMTQLTEGTDMAVIPLSTATSVAYTPVEYGALVSATRKVLDRIKYDGVAATIDRLAYLASRTIETQIALLYNADVPGTSNKMSSQYVATDDTGATITTSADITAANTFNDELILRGVETLQNANNIPFPDGYFRLYVAPAQYKAMMLDSNLRQDLRFGAPQALFSGEVGTTHGCRVIVTNSIQTASEGSGSSVTVYKALMVAPRWAAVAWKRRPAVVVDPTLYDLGRRRQFGVTGDWDIELLHNERAVVLTSA
jgi:N4-gp56 family major capsid protein